MPLASACGLLAWPVPGQGSLAIWHVTLTLECGGDRARVPNGRGPDESRVMAMMWGYDWGWGAWLVMSMMMVLFWGLVIAGIVVLVRYLAGGRQGGPPAVDRGQASAEELLDERFARGEIDADDYTSRRQALRMGR